MIFGKQFINKNPFHKNKRPISTDKVDIRRKVLSKKYLYAKKGSFKYFIEYISETSAFPIPLCIKFPQMDGYFKYFDSNDNYLNLLVHDKEFLKKYNVIWDKISNLLKNEFDSEPVYNDKYIKTKIKTCNNRISTIFHGNKIPEDNDNECYFCLSVISIDSIVNVGEKYYPQIFFEECKHAVKKKNIINAIN